jgi:hypothetical protein
MTFLGRPINDMLKVLFLIFLNVFNHIMHDVSMITNERRAWKGSPLLCLKSLFQGLLGFSLKYLATYVVPDDEGRRL